MLTINTTPVIRLSPESTPAEIVERKGIGHPDTICDALAEELSLALCHYYRETFGFILHHNVDKALLWGGVAQSAFNGGEVIRPIEIFLAGRATLDVKGIKVPVEELMVETSRTWLRQNLHALDCERHIKLHTLIRSGSDDLLDLYLRQHKNGSPLANDTSCGVGYAPLDELERIVYQVEHQLNSAAIKASHPYIGEDIKVMGVRQGDHIDLTVACAFIDTYITDIDDYMQKKLTVSRLTRQVSAELTARAVAVEVNSADSMNTESLYLTVTGTSAESGDDGEVGRGNRVNGLITPYRPMNLEAAAGKNPVTHTGKIYNIVAHQIAEAIVKGVPAVEEAQCYLVSRIGHPIDEPQLVDLRLQLSTGTDCKELEPDLHEIVRQNLAGLTQIQDQLLAGTIKVY